MKSLYLTVQQAKALGGDLVEYAEKKDYHDRLLFKGFEIRFGDILADGMQSDQSFEMTPIPEFTEISADTTD